MSYAVFMTRAAHKNESCDINPREKPKNGATEQKQTEKG